MSTKVRQRGTSLLELLLGREPEEGAATYTYQTRQSRLVRNGSFLYTVIAVAIVWFAANTHLALGIVAAFWLLFARIHYFIAAAADAVFDSVWERINQQSVYLDSRFQTLERKLNSPGAKYRNNGEQALGESNYSPELSECFFDYPGRRWEQKINKRLHEEVKSNYQCD